jgi:hypothetical protein
MIGRRYAASGGRTACRKMLAYACALPDVHTYTNTERWNRGSSWLLSDGSSTYRVVWKD